MTRYALAFLVASCMGAPAHALTPPPGINTFGPRALLLPGDDACEAVIEVWNLAGRYNGEETLRTERGDVLIRYQTVGLHQPGNDDTVEVIGLPDGLHAAPMMAEVQDGAVLSICLFEYIGG